MRGTPRARNRVGSRRQEVEEVPSEDTSPHRSRVFLLPYGYRYVCALPIYAIFYLGSSCIYLAPPDVEAITYEHEVKLQDSDSIYMTIPPLLPRLLDLPLPFPSSPFNSSSSLYLDDQGYPVMSPTPSDIDCHLLYPTDTGTRMFLPGDPYADGLNVDRCSFYRKRYRLVHA